MNRIIIVEGSQGVGKTTLTNELRERIPSLQLMRLSGLKEKNSKAKEKSQKMYENLLHYLKNMEEIPIDFLFDRFFFSEQVFCQAHFKDYSFSDAYDKLLSKLYQLNYEIVILFLKLEDTSLFEKRIEKAHHHSYESYDLQKSRQEQKNYEELFQEIDSKRIRVLEVFTDKEVDYEKLIEKIERN